MSKFIARFLKDESGATAIEYGLIAAGIGLLLVVAAPALGSKISDLFAEIGAAM